MTPRRAPRHSGAARRPPRPEARRVTLRRAGADDALALSELAIRSKGHWGYDDTFLESCRAELTIDPTLVEKLRVVVVERERTPIGFYSLLGEPPEAELGHLFVAPEWIGLGIGRQLWEHMRGAAVTLGFGRVTIEADPGAAPFYEAMGARRFGTAPSGSIAGRELPLFSYDLSSPTLRAGS